MQRKKSEKSSLELPAFRDAQLNAMRRKHRKFFIVLWLIAASLLPSARAQEANNSKPE